MAYTLTACLQAEKKVIFLFTYKFSHYAYRTIYLQHS